MSISYPADGVGRAPLERVLADLRPRLHRYTARMTGSAVDGEDVVQDAIVKAIEAFPTAGVIANVEGWVFRILHNAALDFLRRRSRQRAIQAADDLDWIVDPTTAVDDRQIAAASLRTFMQLPPAQRSCVILMDVLGYSLDEIAGISGMSVAAVKAALHKGRARLGALARQGDDPAPRLAEADHRRLAAYVDLFNARDFDALRDLLAEDVRLDLVARHRRDGRSDVGRYFENYQRQADWRCIVGLADGRPAVLVCDPDHPADPPVYFVLLDWAGDRISRIRDYRYARHVAAEATLTPSDAGEQ
jgi:RNA polymerase sigma-70 factor, ECF subfamily